MPCSLVHCTITAPIFSGSHCTAPPSRPMYVKVLINLINRLKYNITKINMN